MNKMFHNHKAVGVGLIAGISCLVANPAQAALFNFSYTFEDLGAPPVAVPTTFQGMVEGTQDGNNLLDPTITMFDVIQDGTVVASFTDSQFINKVFTFDGSGLLILSDQFSLPTVALEEGDAASYVDSSFEFTTESFEPDRWSLTAKPVPENDMSLVSWLALAAIGGLSVKYGKRKSL